MFRFNGSPAVSRSSKRKRRKPAGGFTLLEVLAAFTVLALMLGALLQVFSGGLRSADVARKHALATLRAQSLLAAIGTETPLVEGEDAGSFDDGYRWRYTVERYHDAGAVDVEDQEIIPYRVTVSVDWGWMAAGRSVTLSTLRLALPAEAETGDRR